MPKDKRTFSVYDDLSPTIIRKSKKYYLLYDPLGVDFIVAIRKSDGWSQLARYKSLSAANDGFDISSKKRTYLSRRKPGWSKRKRKVPSHLKRVTSR